MSVLNLTQIRIDGGTQLRARTLPEHVQELRDALLEGQELPAVKVIHDGKFYWLWDGFHTYFAHRAANKSTIECDVTPGTQREAILKAAGANASHGLKRSAEDKREAVLSLLKDKEWCEKTDRWIASACRVAHTFVADIRKSRTGGVNSTCTENNGATERRKGQDGKTYAVPRKKLCERCERVGPVKNCEGCKALRSGREPGGDNASGVPKPEKPAVPKPEKPAVPSGAEVFNKRTFTDAVSTALRELDKLAHQHCLLNGRGQPQSLEHKGLVRLFDEACQGLDAWLKQLKKSSPKSS